MGGGCSGEEPQQSPNASTATTRGEGTRRKTSNDSGEPTRGSMEWNNNRAPLPQRQQRQGTGWRDRVGGRESQEEVVDVPCTWTAVLGERSLTMYWVKLLLPRLRGTAAASAIPNLIKGKNGDLIRVTNTIQGQMQFPSRSKTHSKARRETSRLPRLASASIHAAPSTLPLPLPRIRL